MNSLPDDQASRVIALIQNLLPVPERRPGAMDDGMAKFLAEAASLEPIVSAPAERRHSEWKSIFSRKAPLKMTTIATLLAIFTMLFGGTGATVYAAQGSLPDQPLYGVKLATEDVRADLTTNSQNRMALMMNFADLRMREASQLAAQGKAIPASVWQRMAEQYDLALLTAAGLDDAQLYEALPVMQARMLANRNQLMQFGGNSRYSGDVARLQAILQSDLQVMGMGMSDPSGFRQTMWSGNYRNGWQMPRPAGSATPLPTISPTTTPWQTVTPWSPTQAPRNNNRNNNCQWDCCCGQHDGGHHGGGWGGGWGH